MYRDLFRKNLYIFLPFYYTIYMAPAEILSHSLEKPVKLSVSETKLRKASRLWERVKKLGEKPEKPFDKYVRERTYEVALLGKDNLGPWEISLPKEFAQAAIFERRLNEPQNNPVWMAARRAYLNEDRGRLPLKGEGAVTRTTVRAACVTGIAEIDPEKKELVFPFLESSATPLQIKTDNPSKDIGLGNAIYIAPPVNRQKAA